MQFQSCGLENPVGFRFCGGCGRPLKEGHSEPERRQITLMFCDLVDSTVLSQRLDPEEFHRLIQSYQDVCSDIITRYEGHIAQYLGDGLLVYFGYPLAHEDDAQRAVRAAMEIIRAIQGLAVSEQLDQTIELRIGIHTGMVVIGEMGRGQKREILALGDTPNIASRVQGLAEPNTVLISSTTYRLVQGYFDCDNKGIHELKGVLSPVGV